MNERFTRLVAVAVALIAAAGIGFSVGAAADEPDAIDEMQRVHDQMHSSPSAASMEASHDHDDMDAMHAEMTRRMTAEDRELHDRMHHACADTANERNNR